VTTWLLRRTGAALAIVFTVLTLTFVAIHLAPGTPFLPRGDRPLDPVVEARLRRQFGLDQPLPLQYARYLEQLAHGNFGESFSQHRPVADALSDAVPNTLVLGAAALAIEFLLGLAIGVYQAARARRPADAALTYVTLFLYSLPIFWLGLVLLLLFGAWLHLFPIGGVVDPLHDLLPLGARVFDRVRHLALPAFTLGLVGAAGTARFQRGAMLEALAQDFIRTARAKGVAERGVLIGHALRNALLPYVTLLGLALPFLLTGAVLAETVFAWPGMGKLAADAIASRDYPVVTATMLVASIVVVGGCVLAGLLCGAADPRVRLEGRG